MTKGSLMSEDKHTYKYKLYYTTLLPQHLFVPPHFASTSLFTLFGLSLPLFSFFLTWTGLPSLWGTSLDPPSPVLLPDGELDGACAPCLLAVNTHRVSRSLLCPAHAGSVKPSLAGVKLHKVDGPCHSCFRVPGPAGGLELLLLAVLTLRVSHC